MSCVLDLCCSSLQAGKSQQAGTPCCPPPSPADRSFTQGSHAEGHLLMCTTASSKDGQAEVGQAELHTWRTSCSCSPLGAEEASPKQTSVGTEASACARSALSTVTRRGCRGEPAMSGVAAAAVASHATALRTPPAAFLHPWVAGECVTSPPLRAGATPRQSWVGDPQTTQSKEASTRINHPPSMSSWGACVSCACQMTHWKRGSEPG